MSIADRFNEEYCTTCPATLDCNHSKQDKAACASMLMLFYLKDLNDALIAG